MCVVVVLTQKYGYLVASGRQPATRDPSSPACSGSSYSRAMLVAEDPIQMRQDVRVARTNWLFGGRRARPLANGRREHMQNAGRGGLRDTDRQRPGKCRPPQNLHRSLWPRSAVSNGKFSAPIRCIVVRSHTLVPGHPLGTSQWQPQHVGAAGTNPPQE